MDDGMQALQSLDNEPVAAGGVESPKGGKKIKLLMELRPALEGFAGIPQETRLLFSAFRDFDGVETTELINHFKLRLSHTLKKGKHEDEDNIHKKINALSRHVISHKVPARRKILEKILWLYKRDSNFVTLRLATFFGIAAKDFGFSSRRI